VSPPEARREVAISVISSIGEEVTDQTGKVMVDDCDLCRGMPRLAGEIADIVGLEPACGREALAAALERGLAYRRYRAADLRAILAAGSGVPRHREPGERLTVSPPEVPVRSIVVEGIRQYFELTTPLQVAAHLARGGLYELATIITYVLP
jgi:hypothetical protein